MNATRLIVNADDFGMSRGITSGILEAHRHGIVTSTSLMPNMPAAEYAMACLPNFGSLGVGVHLNICAGRPILPRVEIPSLVGRNGHFHPPAVMIRKLWTWQAAPAEIEAEFRAQIQWMKSRGTLPTHADSHHHMHIYPAAVAPFARALSSEGISRARAPRCIAWPQNSAMGGPYRGSFLRRVLVQAYRRTVQQLVFRRFAMPRGRISFSSRDRNDLSRCSESWKTALSTLPSGTFELACHPGLFERGFSESDPIHMQREIELQWLLHRDRRNALEKSGIQLITYAALEEPCAPISATKREPVLQ